jgi:hypothetical protein
MLLLKSTKHRVCGLLKFGRPFSTKDDILPDHLVYNIPKYEKNENFDFPWLIGGAPFLEIKVKAD